MSLMKPGIEGGNGGERMDLMNVCDSIHETLKVTVNGEENEGQCEYQAPHVGSGYWVGHHSRNLK